GISYVLLNYCRPPRLRGQASRPAPGSTHGAPMNDRTERGLKIFSELLGQAAGAAMRNVIEHPEQFGAPIARLAADYAFADVWGREGLERRQRSLVTLGILIASRQTLELKNHVRIAVA